jgi:hypothetical protein
MAAKVSRTLQMLLELRGDVGQLREDVGQINERLDRIETTVHGDLVNVANVLIQVRDLLRTGLVQPDRFEDHERRITELERRFGT